MSSGFVSGFNGMATFLGTTVGGWIPKKEVLNSAMHVLAQGTNAGGIKTVVVKPLALVGQLLNWAGKEKQFPVAMRLAGEASATKALMNACEVFSKFPNFVKSITTPAKEDKYRQFKDANALKEGAAKSQEAVVFRRLFYVADYLIAVGGMIAFSKHCEKPFRPSVMNLTPWIQALSGGYMGLQDLFEEYQCAKGSWLDESKKAAPTEKYFGLLNMATNVTYLFSSAVGLAGLYYKQNPPPSLGNWQMAATAASIIAPAIQSCARSYMETSVWTRPKQS